MTEFKRLKGTIAINKLYREGESLFQFPLSLKYQEQAGETKNMIRVGVSVGKKHFKKAVDRNRIKRLLRETFHQQKKVFKNNSFPAYTLMIMYVDRNLPKFNELNKQMARILERFSKQIESHTA